jgi:hypothetical protein
VLRRISSGTLNFIHHVIANYWVHPIENHIFPHLEAGNKTWLMTAAIRLVSWCANIGRIAVLDFRLKVRRWVCDDWSVTYIGEGESMEAIRTV